MASVPVTILGAIVEFRILGYPGPSKERDTEVRLMQGKIFRGKTRMYLQLYVVRNYNFKLISVKEMEPNFVRMTVPEWPEMKKYLQSVSRISVAKKLLDLSVKAHELAIKLTSISEAVKSVGTSPSRYTGRQ